MIGNTVVILVETGIFLNDHAQKYAGTLKHKGNCCICLLKLIILWT